MCFSALQAFSIQSWSVSVRFRVKVRVTAGILNTVMVGCVRVSVRVSVRVRFVVRVRLCFSALQAFSTQSWLVVLVLVLGLGLGFSSRHCRHSQHSHGWSWLVMVGYG